MAPGLSRVLYIPPPFTSAVPAPSEMLSGHLPAHEVSENVEAVQVRVLAAPVHVAPSDRLAQFVRVGENRQHIICRGGRSWVSLRPVPNKASRVVLSLAGRGGERREEGGEGGGSREGPRQSTRKGGVSSL